MEYEQGLSLSPRNFREIGFVSALPLWHSPYSQNGVESSLLPHDFTVSRAMEKRNVNGSNREIAPLEAVIGRVPQNSIFAKNASIIMSSVHYRLQNHGFPPGLSKQAPFLQPNASSEKGALSLPYASGLRASSELSISDSLTWQLDDPAIVSSQLNPSASASQNQTDANWKPVFGSVSPVDLLQQIWRSGSNAPPFDGHVASYSHYAAQTNSPNNVATSSNQRQTIRDSSLHSASQTD
ncbi:hypothetical protein X801_10194 [Opisthorchis viverrini]|uniref:Uncharacterized protein n=1 Tax=Opisthorchis viverrini TaxID=6198 RepID=A0A1S8WHV1_OPIVI|nr:hypothetical protein X801_10194 [Opisthorchis viverrini]